MAMAAGGSGEEVLCSWWCCCGWEEDGELSSVLGSALSCFLRLRRGAGSCFSSMVARRVAGR
jgi:hypothetical protein